MYSSLSVPTICNGSDEEGKLEEENFSKTKHAFKPKKIIPIESELDTPSSPELPSSPSWSPPMNHKIRSTSNTNLSSLEVS